ncbi:prepilin peptidase [Citricoccus sp. SGAir0253]|nr:prepilin peptidase [Citricoccus sp. SGAir0253]
MVTLLLAGLAAVAGAGVGWWGWSLAAAEERTTLPRRWRPVLALATAIAWAAAVLAVTSPWAWPAALVLGAGVVALGAIDLRSRLLPNRLVGPFGVAAAVALAVAALGLGEPLRLAGAAAGAAGLFAVYLLLALVSPGSLGMGDVKIAAVLGAYGGWLGWSAWVATALSGFVLGAVMATVLLLARLAGRRDRFAYGPAMLLGTLSVVLLAG